jgi:hypothetical protein
MATPTRKGFEGQRRRRFEKARRRRQHLGCVEHARGERVELRGCDRLTVHGKTFFEIDEMW